MSPENSNRVEKSVTLRVPRHEVWKALTDPKEFGEWFGAKISGTFRPGQMLRGPVTHQGYEHLTMEFTVERMEEDRLLSWRWHPYVPDVDWMSAPPTLVTFTLDDADEGTELTVTETGFNQLPEEFREKARSGNDDGWTQQMLAIEKHVGAVV